MLVFFVGVWGLLEGIAFAVFRYVRSMAYFLYKTAIPPSFAVVEFLSFFLRPFAHWCGYRT